MCPPDVKNQTFSGPLTPEPQPKLHYELTAEIVAPPDPCLHFTIISGLLVMKWNFQKLNLCSKMDISKTAWINA